MVKRIISVGNKIKISFLISFCFVFFACYNPSKISFTNISSNYLVLSKNFNLNICSYKFDSKNCKIYYKFNSQGLFFQKDLKKNYFYSYFKVNYEIYKKSNLKQILDSSSIRFMDTIHFNNQAEIMDSFVVNMKDGEDYVLSLYLTDVNSKNNTTKYLYISCNNHFSRNNFHLVNENGVPYVKNYISHKEKFDIICSDKQIQKLYVKYIKKNFPIAEPPYILSTNPPLSFKFDSTFTIDINNGSSDLISLSKTGIYHFQTDTNQKEGLTVFRFYDDFPEITSTDQMLMPLIYITTKSEFADLKNSNNTKLAIDNFWLDKAGNPDRASELIRSYYNRVQDANRFFTSYTEGWKTDRGMAYIILGQPLNVFHSATNETWYYGPDRNMVSITLVFVKTLNPFTDNDYTLQRSIEYKDIWYNGVENWRR